MESTEQLILDIRKALENETDTDKYRLLTRVLIHLKPNETIPLKACAKCDQYSCICEK